MRLKLSLRRAPPQRTTVRRRRLAAWGAVATLRVIDYSELECNQQRAVSTEHDVRDADGDIIPRHGNGNGIEHLASEVSRHKSHLNAADKRLKLQEDGYASSALGFPHLSRRAAICERLNEELVERERERERERDCEKETERSRGEEVK